MTPKEFFAFAKKHEADMVDLKFTDLLGSWQHCSFPIETWDEETFRDGVGFDGSSIRGWQAIDVSDMLAVPDPGYKGRYPFLQYQHAGDDSFYDRTRKVFRDYHLDWLWNPASTAQTSTLKLPDASKTFEGNCAGCHFPNFTPTQDPTTQEWLASSVSDSGEVYVSTYNLQQFAGTSYHRHAGN